MLTDENIEDLRQKIRDLKPQGIKEKKTRKRLINRTLRFLRWFLDDDERVDEEYQVPKLQNARKGKVDYALLVKKGKPAILVEAKRLGDLGKEAVEQLKDYGSKEIIKRGTRNLAFLVLTDGNVWEFHPIWHEAGEEYYGNWCYTRNIGKGKISEVKEDLNNLLAHDQVVSGESSKYLEKLFRLHCIRKAYRLILSGPDAKLVDLVEDKVEDMDYAPDREEVKQFLNSQRALLGEDEALGIKKSYADSPQRSEDDKTRHVRRAKPKKLEVKWGNKEFKNKEAIQIMHEVIISFANEFRIGTVARRAKECKGDGVPTVVANTEVDKYKEGKESITYDGIDGHPNYVYLKRLSSVAIADRLSLLAKALNITDDQFEVKLDGKLHRKLYRRNLK